MKKFCFYLRADLKRLFDRMLVLAAPAVLYYFTDYVLEGIFPGRVNLGLIFSASYNLFSDDLLSVLFAVLITVANFVLLWVLMVKKIRSIYEE